MSPKVKVLHIIGRRPRGGIGTFLKNTHCHIDRSKIQFDYLINESRPHSDFEEVVKSYGGNVYILPELTYKNTFKYFAALFRFYRQHHDYDVMHVHSANIAIFNFLFAIIYGIRHRVIHSHNTRFSDKRIRGIRNFVLQLPNKLFANIFVACGAKAALFMYGKRYVRSRKVHILKNAIDPLKFRYSESLRKELRKKLDIENNYVVGHVGAFVPQKNHLFILQIFNEIYQLQNKSTLMLIGTGDLEDEIRSAAKSLDCSHAIRFMGARNDVNQLMQAFDVFILPSLFEGLPLVGIEAQAAGLPCVFSKEISSEVKITEHVSFLSINATPKEWSSVINNYYELNLRKDTSQEVKEAGYDILHATGRLQQLYLSL